VRTKDTFQYNQLDSKKLAAVLNQKGVVEVLLSPKQAKLITKVISIILKIDQASVAKNTKLKKFDFYKAMLLNLRIMIFYPKLIEITGFYILEKPKYLLEYKDTGNWILIFERQKPTSQIK